MENLLKIKAIFQQLYGITRITYKSTAIIHARNHQIKKQAKPVISTKYLYFKYKHVKYQLFIVILKKIFYELKMKKTMKTKHFIIAFFTLVLAVINANANNMLVQNVTTLNDNPTAKTVQVQFDLSWDNSWRDSINWDAAWIFLKFKDANGLWQHAKLNTNGFQNGSGTSNTVQVTSDNVGAWVYRDTRGSGTFNSTTMQLQWNYGLSGLTKVTGLEVRVFAVEMVYVPEGDFNVAKLFNNSTEAFPSYRYFNAPGKNHPVINNKLSPTLNYNDGSNSIEIRIKGDVGVDTDNNGLIDNSTYPTGYHSFYCYKFEMSEQQYADFLNTLTPLQISTIGIAGNNITLNDKQYFSSSPNMACGKSNEIRLLAYADWAGLRPMSILEFNKVSYGPLVPEYYENSCWDPHELRFKGYPAWGSGTNGGFSYANRDIPTNVGSHATPGSNRIQSGASYYGVLDLTGNVHEPVVKMGYFAFQNNNGNGVLLDDGISDVNNWKNSSMLTFIDMICNAGYDLSGPYAPCSYNYSIVKYGFRYVRSAE